MALDQRVQRSQRRGAGADLIGERRQAEVDAFAGVALALPVQRLMLAELLEQDHRQQTRAGEAARGDMERRRRLGDRLASPAGEPLPNGLDHLPLAGDDLERLGDVLAELRQLRRAAAGAAQRRRDHDPLARQMLGKGLSRRPPALEGFDDGRGRRAFGREFVLGRVRLGVLQLHLQLVEKPLLALRAHAVERAPKLFDLQLQIARSAPRRSTPSRERASDRLQRAPLALRFEAAQPARRGSSHALRPGRRGENQIASVTSEGNHKPHGFVSKNPQPAAVGRQVFCGIRQSMPSSR